MSQEFTDTTDTLVGNQHLSSDNSSSSELDKTCDNSVQDKEMTGVHSAKSDQKMYWDEYEVEKFSDQHWQCA